VRPLPRATRDPHPLHSLRECCARGPSPACPLSRSPRVTACSLSRFPRVTRGRGTPAPLARCREFLASCGPPLHSLRECCARGSPRARRRSACARCPIAGPSPACPLSRFPRVTACSLSRVPRVTRAAPPPQTRGPPPAPFAPRMLRAGFSRARRRSACARCPIAGPSPACSLSRFPRGGSSGRAAPPPQTRGPHPCGPSPRAR
jgi:hypothetical protein